MNTKIATLLAGSLAIWATAGVVGLGVVSSPAPDRSSDDLVAIDKSRSAAGSAGAAVSALSVDPVSAPAGSSAVADSGVDASAAGSAASAFCSYPGSAAGSAAGAAV